jgi:hypothetical protein
MKIEISKNLYDNVKSGWDAGYSIYELGVVNEIAESVVRQIVDNWNIIINND